MDITASGLINKFRTPEIFFTIFSNETIDPFNPHASSSNPSNNSSHKPRASPTDRNPTPAQSARSSTTNHSTTTNSTNPATICFIVNNTGRDLDTSNLGFIPCKNICDPAASVLGLH